MQKQRTGKGQEQMAHTVLAAPRTNRAPPALPGRDGGMANAGQNNAHFGQASMGQQAFPKQQTITFVPAMLKHLAPQKAEKSGLGRTPRVSSPSEFSCLKAPPRFSSSGVDPWMVN